MASNIDPAKPTPEEATTASVRQNFQSAKDEIEVLQDKTQNLDQDGNLPVANVTGDDVSANSWVLDEDDMSSDDATKVPTQQSVKAYVDGLTNGIVMATGAQRSITHADADQSVVYAGGPDGNLGGNLVAYGPSHTTDASQVVFRSGTTERGRVDGSGNILWGQSTTTDPAASNVVGVAVLPNGRLIVNSAASGVRVGRTSDGSLVNFYSEGVAEGSIDVSGTTITYGTFCGAHWSQLADNSHPEILRGTVMETIDALCEWPGEVNEHLAKSKVSDTAASKSVYGVFAAWDDNDGPNPTNDFWVASLGAFLVRVKAGETVAKGDLLESAGDGTARVQADDVMRASTIAKVTAATVVEIYEDGSYLVPCTLHCG